MAPINAKQPSPMSLTYGTLAKPCAARPGNQQGLLKEVVPVPNENDDNNVIQVDKLGVCLWCGTMGVKHAFYTKERNFCTQACVLAHQSNGPPKIQPLPTYYFEEAKLKKTKKSVEKGKLLNPLKNIRPRRDKESIANTFKLHAFLSDAQFNPAPVSLFHHAPARQIWGGIVVGMKVEIYSTAIAASYLHLEVGTAWFATLMKVRGYYGHFRYVGFKEHVIGSDSRYLDVWVNICSENVRTVGWSAANGKPLVPPKALAGKLTTEDWHRILSKELSGGSTIPWTFAEDTAASQVSRFSQGMKVEAVDKNRIAQVKLATIEDVSRKRLIIRYFDSEPDDNGFICHEDSPLLHPVGWAAAVDAEIDAPLQYLVSTETDRLTRSYDMTNKYFKQPPMLGYTSNPPIETGMKLEAIDPLNLSAICVATVKKMLQDGYMMIRIDSYAEDESHSDWFCYHVSSPHIFPAGFCNLHNIKLVPPKGYRGDKFVWSDYLEATGYKAAPLSNRPVPNHKFKVGMWLEAADLMDPRQICVANISRVCGHLLRVHFDGWGDEYDQWLDCECPDFYPIGWCEMHGHRLEGSGSVPVNSVESGEVINITNVTGKSHKALKKNKEKSLRCSSRKKRKILPEIEDEYFPFTSSLSSSVTLKQGATRKKASPLLSSTSNKDRGSIQKSSGSKGEDSSDSEKYTSENNTNPIVQSGTQERSSHQDESLSSPNLSAYESKEYTSKDLSSPTTTGSNPTPKNIIINSDQKEKDDSDSCASKSNSFLNFKEKQELISTMAETLNQSSASPSSVTLDSSLEQLIVFDKDSDIDQLPPKLSPHLSGTEEYKSRGSKGRFTFKSPPTLVPSTSLSIAPSLKPRPKSRETPSTILLATKTFHKETITSPTFNRTPLTLGLTHTPILTLRGTSRSMESAARSPKMSPNVTNDKIGVSLCNRVTNVYESDDDDRSPSIISTRTKTTTERKRLSNNYEKDGDRSFSNTKLVQKRAPYEDATESDERQVAVNTYKKSLRKRKPNESLLPVNSRTLRKRTRKEDETDSDRSFSNVDMKRKVLQKKKPNEDATDSDSMSSIVMRTKTLRKMMLKEDPTDSDKSSSTMKKQTLQRKTSNDNATDSDMSSSIATINMKANVTDSESGSLMSNVLNENEPQEKKTTDVIVGTKPNSALGKKVPTVRSTLVRRNAGGRRKLANRAVRACRLSLRTKRRAAAANTACAATKRPAFKTATKSVHRQAAKSTLRKLNTGTLSSLPLPVLADPKDVPWILRPTPSTSYTTIHSASARVIPCLLGTSGTTYDAEDVEPSEWSVKDVAHFLRVNNCGQYSESFSQRKIGGQTLLNLTYNTIILLTSQKAGPALLINDLIEKLKTKISKRKANKELSVPFDRESRK